MLFKKQRNPRIFGSRREREMLIHAIFKSSWAVGKTTDEITLAAEWLARYIESGEISEAGI